jgi:hypothetical protein
LDHLSDLLTAIGGDLSMLVDVTVFLTDMAHYARFNTIYNAYFDASTGPTRSTRHVLVSMVCSPPTSSRQHFLCVLLQRVSLSRNFPIRIN